jgi:hypothetical protein
VSELRAFIDSAPQPQRAAMRILTWLGRRARGRALLGRFASLEQLSSGLLAMERYEHPTIARALGFDARAVSQRGLALRRSERRP